MPWPGSGVGGRGGTYGPVPSSRENNSFPKMPIAAVWEVVLTFQRRLDGSAPIDGGFEF